MPANARRTFWIAATLFLALTFVGPSLASAQYREFTGKIQKISKKKFIVDNRQGDKVRFEFVKDTEVSGEKKKIKDIKVNDWVTVSWKFIDKPRKAYKIKVIPPRETEED
jgi:hypothetical protein